MSEAIRPGSKECICDWPDFCGGSGTLRCEGCDHGAPNVRSRGDLCVCRCGGIAKCPGCHDCFTSREELV